MSQKEISKIQKRNGSVVTFDENKIANAINKALAAALVPDTNKATDLSKKVVDRLSSNNIENPTVEDIQDIVESILLENGLSEVAKAYIVYRHEHRKLREDKKRVLNTDSLDSVAKAFDIKCLRVLASRYLFRDSKNEIREQPEELFNRVATHMAVADILYDDLIFDRNGKASTDLTHRKNSVVQAQSYYEKLDNFDNKFHIGKYYLNKYHFRALINDYIYLAKQGKMKVDFKELLQLLAGGKFINLETKIAEYAGIMISQDFLPNSPTLMNAGGRLGQLSACFVLDMQDDLGQIMKSSKDAAMIFQSGGGVGINYSALRPEGDIVASTSGVASGPLSFMEIVNTVTEVVKQGGKRRGANMGILECNHPDIEKFITNKTKAGVLENFNVSVGVWADFWQALVNSENGKYMLKNPRSGKNVREINAHQLIELIALSAWKSAEPGLIFLDNVNKYNVFAPARGGPLRTTNPCGEQSLYPYESCNLGSINLSNLVIRDADGTYEFDWQRYEETIRKTTRMLDNIIDVNEYPIPEIDQASRDSRRIGLGVMGVGDLLYKLKIPYNSKEGYDLQGNLAEALSYFSMDESVSIARERGEFPLFSQTEYVDGKIPISGFYEKDNHRFDWTSLIEKIKEYGIRNVLTTTVAPTGTLAMLADCSSGMEPNFSLSFEKNVTVGKFIYTNGILEQELKKLGVYSEELLEKIANNYGSVRGLSEIPKHVQDVFVTAMDIHWSDHLLAQAAWQDWIGNAISKTINMPHDVTAEDVKAAYLLAHELGLKGITVYRDGSRHTQVLSMSDETAEKRFDVYPSESIHKLVDAHENQYVKKHIMEALTRPSVETPEISDDVSEPVPLQVGNKDKTCPTCKGELTFAEGCSICIECGFSGCSSG